MLVGLSSIAMPFTVSESLRHFRSSMNIDEAEAKEGFCSEGD